MNEEFCVVCGKELEVGKYATHKKYCSPYCKNRRKRGMGSRNIVFYSVPAECGCGCGEIIMNPDNHYRIRNFIYGHQNKNGLSPRLGYKEPEEHVIYRISRTLASFKKETCLEKELYAFLEKTGLEFEKQKQFGRTRPDAYVPKLNLCIYADGAYWHNTEAGIARDKRADLIIQKYGKISLRLPSIDNGYHLDMSLLREYLDNNN